MNDTRPSGVRQEPQTDRYTRLPDQLLSELSPREHQLVHLLLSYRWTDDAAIYPSVPTMAARLNCSERTIQRTLRRLEGAGYVVVVGQYRSDHGQTSNEYRPGPMLLPLLPLLPPAGAGAVTARRDDRHPPVTRTAGERYSGNYQTSKSRSGRPDIRAPRDYYATSEGVLRVRT